MKTLFCILVVSSLVTAALVGCQPAAPGETVTIGEQQAGDTIELHTGDTLRVALPGNLTTGFNWIPAPQDPALLEQVGEPQMTPASSALGASGTIVLTFEATAPGQTLLHLDYRRAWEEDVAPEATFEVTVMVE